MDSKKGGYEFYRDVLGSPKFIVAPMVDQSELAWRILARRYGSQLVYTPMISAKMFADSKHPQHRKDDMFDLTHGEEGGPLDRPLVVQFCANDPQALLTAAMAVQDRCDAVDINFGCPQDIARRGRYGSFLQDEWDLIYNLINILHKNLKVPVTAKFRIFPDVNKTVAYAQMMERAGAQILTCHGRIREQRGQNSGLADWAQIAAVKAAVKVPVFANGNILYHSDIARCLEVTKADGVMSAEGQLYNAALFAQTTPTSGEEAASGLHPPHADLALEYLDIVESLKTHTAMSAIKGHLFKLMRPGLLKELDLRDRLGKIGKGTTLNDIRDLVLEMKSRMERDANAATALESTIIDDPNLAGTKIVPHWLAQPYFRPLPTPEQIAAMEKKRERSKSHQGPAQLKEKPVGVAEASPTELHDSAEPQNGVSAEQPSGVPISNLGKRSAEESSVEVAVEDSIKKLKETPSLS
ncbi:hypothetical protein BOTBODRAFT_143810 [Botryobasidium botryosum FD-172 SS1]|uniref:tRNA-dihydrouridine(16/17) synthase [NAD(P)(+)] n=1 Tax=Botryobasidium botryosum (strain FD-172 SS1) TaxID=930990 RepID=A0A067MRD4_BOTB1|nr:hypothetical protein BOTBODRAFT_143810 [Botryobasidium botryosum FD-172 SS1]